MNEAWWEATRDERLLVQRCESCGRHQHYPRAICTSCHGSDLAFVQASGRATVYSFSVVHRAPAPDLEVPYVVALVRLEEGPQLLTNIVDCEPDAVRCDMPVRATWRPMDDGRRLPVFAPET